MREGQKVSHEKFGLGRVVNVLFEARACDVVFDDVKGCKTILSMYLTEVAEPVPVQEKVTMVEEKQTTPHIQTSPFREVAEASAQTGEQLKNKGMKAAADANNQLLVLAQSVARELGREKRLVYMDLVSLKLAAMGITSDQLGNAAGSVFRGNVWRFTGQFHKSSRPGRRAGTQRVWEFVQAA